MACALFAAVSGSSPATVVAIGSIILPAMVKQGFPPRFGAGVITTVRRARHPDPAVDRDGDVRGRDQHVGGRAVHRRHRPGLVLATFLGATTWWLARKNNYPRQPKATWLRALGDVPRKHLGPAARDRASSAASTTGIFTPTEAAAMSAVYAFFVAVFVYKDMTLKKVPKVLLDSANMSAMLLYIITNAVMFSYLMTSEQIPQELAAWMLDKGLGVVAFLLFVNIVLLLAGNVMEPSSIVLIMAPILFPVAMKLGIDPVHFGIMMVVNMEVGMCHPPVGPQPLRRERHHEDGHHRAHDRGLAVAPHDAGVPRRRHLLARAHSVPAACSQAPRQSSDAAQPQPSRDARDPSPDRSFACGRTRAALVRGSAATDRRTGRRRAAGRTRRDKGRKNGIILNLLAFIRFSSEWQAWPSNAPFPSSSPMRLPQNVIGKIYVAVRDQRTQDRRGADALAVRRRSRGFYAVHRERPFFRIWSIS